MMNFEAPYCDACGYQFGDPFRMVEWRSMNWRGRAAAGGSGLAATIYRALFH